MQRLSGILMVLAGVGLGGYTLLPASSDKAETLVEVTRIATSSDAEAIDAPASHPKHLSLPKVVLEGVPAEFRRRALGRACVFTEISAHSA